MRKQQEHQKIHEIRITLIIIIALVVAIIIWAITSFMEQGDSHVIGPFRIPVVVEIIAAVVAIAAASIFDRLIKSQRQLAVSSSLLTLSSTVVAVLVWRSLTVGTVGANIGAGASATIGPVVVGVLIICALRIERPRQNLRLTTFWFAILLTVILMGILITSLWIFA